MKRAPDFLIIGAAKCGTTSLFEYLCQHPQVFGTFPKEPSFFSHVGERPNYAGPGDEYFNRAVVSDPDAYAALFSGCEEKQIAGEASVTYLYSYTAPEQIRNRVPRVKLMVVLRNPADRAFSAWSHKRRDGFETKDFRAALGSEQERIAKNWQHLWHYKRMGYYGAQLKRYFEYFPDEQIAIIDYDDMMRDIGQVLRELYAFLGVDSSFVPGVTQWHNVSGLPRSPALHKFFVRDSKLKSILKFAMPASLRALARRRVTSANIRPNNLSMDPRDRAYLASEYYEDTTLLESLCARDFSSWRS